MVGNLAWVAGEADIMVEVGEDPVAGEADIMVVVGEDPVAGEADIPGEADTMAGVDMEVGDVGENKRTFQQFRL